MREGQNHDDERERKIGLEIGPRESEEFLEGLTAKQTL